MWVGAELQWGWGQEDGLEEGKEAEAPKGGPEGLGQGEGRSSLALHVTVAQPKACCPKGSDPFFL